MNRCIISLLISGLLLLGITPCLYGANYFVTTNGDDLSNTGLSWTNAWREIPTAVQNSTNGDYIYVGPGYFTNRWVNVYREISIIGSDIYTATNPPLTRHTSKTFVSFRPAPDHLQDALMEIQTNNVTIKNMTFDGYFITNVACGIVNQWGNLTVEYCTFRNFRNDIGAYGILSRRIGAVQVPDNKYNYYNFNLFENIIEQFASGIYMYHSPSTCANNEFSTITGANAQAGIIIDNCFLTNGSPLHISIDSNYLNNCAQGIWANNFANPGESIYIRDNVITNCLVGIRVTSADGPAFISNNTIYVGGAAPTPKATPAIGIWVQADSDPWGLAPTDHQIAGNYIADISANTGTVGVLLEYDTTTWTNSNSGVLATVLDNRVSGFDIGLYVQSGTNDIGNPHSPLVGVTATGNEITGSETWAILAEDMTNAVIATGNWLGIYGDPSSIISGTVIYSNWVESGSKYEDSDNDGTNDFLDIDDDNDGLTDTNEIAIRTSPIRTDSDYDGQNDWDEYKVTGTSPTNRYSVFKLTTIPTNTTLNSLRISWPSAINRLYTLYRTTNLAAGFGPPMTNNIFADPSGTNTFIDNTTSNSPHYFYNVAVTNTAP